MKPPAGARINGSLFVVEYFLLIGSIDAVGISTEGVGRGLAAAGETV